MVQPIIRARQIEIHGSPTYDYTNSGDIAPSGVEHFDFEDNSKGEGKYLPFDSVALKNVSNADLKVTVGAHVIFVPANSIVKKNKIAFRQMTVNSNDSANTCSAGQLAISCWVEPIDQDALVRRREARKLRFFGI